ncbi:MAG: hemolysin III family protein [Clostridia bacterium]
MSKQMDRSVKLQTNGEEIFNAISHGIGALLAIVATVLLILRAVRTSDTLGLLSVIVFGITLFLLYIMSTLYHAIAHTGAKRILRIFDHVSIFLLIAGTYTPFTLISLRGWIGYTFFGVIWGVALLNIVLSAISLQKFKVLAMVSYVAMGWVIVLAMPKLIAQMGWIGILYVFLGGLAYTVGILFYSRKKQYFAHAIWHIFVLMGSVLHYIAIYFYVL